MEAMRWSEVQYEGTTCENWWQATYSYTIAMKLIKHESRASRQYDVASTPQPQLTTYCIDRGWATVEPTTLDKDLEITPQKELPGMAEAAWVVVCYPFSTI